MQKEKAITSLERLVEEILESETDLIIAELSTEDQIREGEAGDFDYLYNLKQEIEAARKVVIETLPLFKGEISAERYEELELI